ncbi:glucose dehydrogenase [Terriglobus roseus DSM 18391]|uniref:Glucose dehydrogenase n=1 Tax=Terriglobus roseus (strain DSM 18391 / NRRL B-41598 / KBS 63) TaxID=926566 RepID=I3ZFP4_TERRK|nr:PQQ-binding-like beta-propeller repeat protein [Terriglobus roseus]AFL88062.1 glucose dehydrogenase [Terriglobus roseus DSM 18391]
MKTKIRNTGWVVAVSLCALAAVAAVTPRQRTPTSTLDAGHTRYSGLSEINRGNVQNLKPVWVYDTGVKGRTWQGNPIVVDGVMYLSIPGGASAIDPETGKELWKFVPKGISRPGRDRGVAYWPGDGALTPRIIYATVDRLYALDAVTGVPVGGFGKDGLVNLRDDVADKYPNALYTISSPAAIYKNLAIISPSTQEFGSKGPSGDPRAFDVRTGKLVWRFHTVPQPGEPQDGSWGPEGWKERAGPSAWGGATVDAATGLVFIPIGNPDDSYNGVDRPGKNYYANSIVALDAATGTLKWFYQFTHHDINDVDAPAAPSLIDIRRNGQLIPALVEVPKSGLAFVLDRRTGKPVFGDEERPVPQSDVPGEHSSPTQPFPMKPLPLAKTSVTKADITTMSPEAHAFCLAQWDKLQLHNDGPYTPVSIKGTTLFAPGTSGGGNWGGVSTDPRLGYFFANISNVPTTSRMVPDAAGGYKLEGAYGRFNDPKGWPCINPPWGELIAVNANTGDIAWRTPLGTSDDYGAASKNAGTANIGGSIATAGGLVFIGATVDSRFRAFDSRTGKEVWTVSVPAPAVSTPTTYRGKSGRQYVVIPDGGPGTIGMPGRFSSFHAILLAYALPKPGEAAVDLTQFAPTPMQLPPRPPGGQTPSGPSTAALPASAGPTTLPDGAGKDDVLSMCGQCHGVSTAVAVRRSSEGWHDLIQDMRSRGAQGDNAKAARVQDYLSRYFGMMPVPIDSVAVPKP